MTEDYMGMIKEKVEEVLDDCSKETGRDYSKEVASVLQGILWNSTATTLPGFGSRPAMHTVLEGVDEISKLEQQIEEETGKRISLHELKKCSVLANGLWKQRRDEGYKEFEAYVTQLREGE